MRFAEPLFLLLLLVLPLIFILRTQLGGQIKYSSLHLLKKIRQFTLTDPRQIRRILRSLTLIFIILALARPQAGKKYSEVSTLGVDIILALDTSGSMQALDFKLKGDRVERLDIVKEVVSEFIPKRPNDRMGLVVFGEDAYTQCPLTLDHGVLLDFLKQVKIGMAGDATAIGSALGVSVNRLKDQKARSKVIVLLTDGRSNAGNLLPEKAAELAQTFGIKIYTIGVGTHGPAPFLVDTPFGKQFIYQQQDLDEDLLKKIASTTKGRYFRATDTQELIQIYNEIDQLEKTEIKLKEYTEYEELFKYFIIFAVLMLLAEIVLMNTRYRTLP